MGMNTSDPKQCAPRARLTTGAWLKHSHTPQGSASVGLDWALSSRSSQRIAFTLLELLVVIAVLSILAALLLPSLSAAKQRAKETVCRSNLRQMGYALTLYLDDFGVCPGRFRLPTIFRDLGDGREPLVPVNLEHWVYVSAGSENQPPVGESNPAILR